MAASANAKQHIIDELATLAKKKFQGTRCAIVCPFHADTNPSGTVNLDEQERGAPLGWFRCWSCGTSVSWNKLATQLNLKKLRHRKEKPEDYAQPKRFRETLLAEEAVDEAGFEEDLDQIELDDWTIDEWRDVPVKVLQKVGASQCFHSWRREAGIFLPVNIEGEMRGYVFARMEKPKKKKDQDGDWFTPPSYLNAPGRWSQRYGLLYFDYSVALAKRKGLNTLVLCEGPRDSLRLIRYGIPAVSVLGALNFGEEKRFILEKSELDNLVLFMDGDKAGKDATRHIYKQVKHHFNTDYIKTWKLEPDADPFSCSKKLLRKVRDLVV